MDDPVAAEIIAQLRREVAVRDHIIALSEMKIRLLMEEIRLERIRRYGKRSEKLSDLQLLDLEPGVSTEEIEAESQREPLAEGPDSDTEEEKQPKKNRKLHPGRNDLPAHLERIGKIITCTPEQCICGKCGTETSVIGYETAEVLDMKPVEFFVTVINREKRACGRCIENGVQTAPAVTRIAPKTLFSDAVAIDFVVRKYCDATPLYRIQAAIKRDLGLDLALSTINDTVLRIGELLIPMVDGMKRDLLAGDYIQADETYCGVQTDEKKGKNHTAYFWQFSAPGKGVIFDFRMTRSGEVPQEIFKDYRGILHTDGYAGYENSVGAKEMIHACWSHARRYFIDAIKVQSRTAVSDAKFHPTDKDLSVGAPALERVVLLMDSLFAIDREAREQNLSLDNRHALRQERAPAILNELHALLLEMQQSGLILPKSAAGKAISYTLKRWKKLNHFLEYSVIELSTNWTENSMRPIALGRRNWLHIGSKEAGPRIAAIFSIVESCRKLNVPIRQYLADVLPGMADRSIHALAELIPSAYAVKLAM